MCDAMHFAEELTGRYPRLTARALPAVSISDPFAPDLRGQRLRF